MIYELAGRQGGVVIRQQAHEAGLSDEAIEAHLIAQRWQRTYDGVFVTFTGPLPRPAEIWAAVLAAGPGAVASHETAAELWGLGESGASVIHVSIPTNRRAVHRPGLRLHRSRYLPESGHPALTPPRTRVDPTIVDLVAVSETFREMVGWLTVGCQRRRTTPDRLLSEIAGRSRVRWRREAQAVLADVSDGAETPLELEYVRRVERPHGLPQAHRQRHRRVSLRTQWIDADYVDFRTRVELDGRIGHVGDGSFRDRQRDNSSSEEGWHPLRYGWVEVYDQSCGVAAQVARILRRNGWPGELHRCGPGCGVVLDLAA